MRPEEVMTADGYHAHHVIDTRKALHNHDCCILCMNEYRVPVTESEDVFLFTAIREPASS